MANGPLDGIRIIEIGGIGPGPFCAMHLADLGADVILIERKEPVSPVSADSVAGNSAGILNRGKRAIALDLKNGDDVEIALQLIETADALIETMRPGVMERLGLGPDICLKRNPRLVYGRLTGWGQSGPLSQNAGHDLNYIGLSSAAWYASPAGIKPTPPPTLVGDIGGGAHYLMIGLLAGIINARNTGKGDVVDAAMVDGSAHMMNLLFDLIPSGAVNASERGKSILDGAHWYASYVCSDEKYVSLGSLEPKFYREFLNLMGLKDDPDFKEQYEVSLWPKQSARLTEIIAAKPQTYWCELLLDSDACFAPILSPTEAANHPHNKSREIFNQDHGYLQANPAPRFKKSGRYKAASPPTKKGQHKEEILSELKPNALRDKKI